MGQTNCHKNAVFLMRPFYWNDCATLLEWMLSSTKNYKEAYVKNTFTF